MRILCQYSRTLIFIAFSLNCSNSQALFPDFRTVVRGGGGRKCPLRAVSRHCPEARTVSRFQDSAEHRTMHPWSYSRRISLRFRPDERRVHAHQPPAGIGRQHLAICLRLTPERASGNGVGTRYRLSHHNWHHLFPGQLASGAPGGSLSARQPRPRTCSTPGAWRWLGTAFAEGHDMDRRAPGRPGLCRDEH